MSESVKYINLNEFTREFLSLEPEYNTFKKFKESYMIDGNSYSLRDFFSMNDGSDKLVRYNSSEIDGYLKLLYLKELKQNMITSNDVKANFDLISPVESKWCEVDQCIHNYGKRLKLSTVKVIENKTNLRYCLRDKKSEKEIICGDFETMQLAIYHIYLGELYDLNYKNLKETYIAEISISDDKYSEEKFSNELLNSIIVKSIRKK